MTITTREEIAGLPLQEFEVPILRALDWYSRISWSRLSDSKIIFDGVEEATKLKLTTSKPYTAKSDVLVVRKDGPRLREVGNLAIIAFAPFDGTGDDSMFSLEDIDTGEYPRHTKVLPRSKAAVSAEIHISLSSHDTDLGNDQPPVLLSGNLDLLGFKPDHPSRLVKLSELGDYERDFKYHFGGNFPTTFTTGFYNCLGTPGPSTNGERFGDPHAVYNPWESRVQIAGFLALSPEMTAEHFPIFDILQAHKSH